MCVMKFSIGNNLRNFGEKLLNLHNGLVGNISLFVFS